MKSDTQLETWTHQGSKAQSASTYQIIKTALEDSSAPFAGRDFEIFLQGSYGNDTNIYADSDVDIVIRLTSVYYSDTSALDAYDKAAYDRDFSASTYSWRQFRNEVLSWLRGRFGSDVRDGDKAIYICGNSGRRDADVLVCAEYRRYKSYNSLYGKSFDPGVVFWLPNNSEIVNYPKQHQENSTLKHQMTSNGFKSRVRILKNYRNDMIQRGVLADGVAPSYFIEGLLWNMPPAKFWASHSLTISDFVDWTSSVNSSTLKCANDIHSLVGAGRTSWSLDDFNRYVRALRSDW